MLGKILKPDSMRRWSTCHIDPVQGIATFDGLHITSDSITDRRVDRVLPVLEEEQVFMCRQMSELLGSLPRGALAIDVGTGSGVFAIYAAKYQCRVVAIDNNPRAIDSARENSKANGVNVCRQISDLEEGSIFLDSRSFEMFIEGESFFDTFDIIFLNPPYNPTYVGITTAVHAEAGEDGQRCFRNQIALVPKVLKHGGWCVGNQMTPIVAGYPEALETIMNAFGKCHIRYTHILDPSYVVTHDFLTQQYESYLLNGTKDQNEKVTTYIETISKKYPAFGFVYYEICNDLIQGQDDSPELVERCFVPMRSWKDRVWLHRQIVDNVMYTS